MLPTKSLKDFLRMFLKGLHIKLLRNLPRIKRMRLVKALLMFPLYLAMAFVGLFMASAFIPRPYHLHTAPVVISLCLAVVLWFLVWIWPWGDMS